MAYSLNKTKSARHIEQIIRRLNSLSTLPQTAAELIELLSSQQIDNNLLTAVIESDAALTAKILSIGSELNIQTDPKKSVIRTIIEQASPETLKSELLSVSIIKAYKPLPNHDSERLVPRHQLALYNLAAACACEHLTAEILGAQHREKGYCAGLVHDIGKLAIDQVMPKSFEKMAAMSKSTAKSLLEIERQELGIDHCLLGKRLAEKWNLPREMVLAVWLNGTNSEILFEQDPQAGIAKIVHLGSLMARKAGIGDCGSYEPLPAIEPLADSLGVERQKIEKIMEDLEDMVQQKAELAGLAETAGPKAYPDIIHTSCTKLINSNTKLNIDNKKLNAEALNGRISSDFLSKIHPNMTASELGEKFGIALKKHLSVEKLCLCITNEHDENITETVLIDETGKSDTDTIQIPEGTGFSDLFDEPVSKWHRTDKMGWFFEQIQISFNHSHTCVLPLDINGSIKGALVLQAPDIEKQYLVCDLEAILRILTRVLNFAGISRANADLSEKFAMAVSSLEITSKELANSASFEAVAEIAAGAAHELNNPLSIISGRVQLLKETAQDQARINDLEQIRQKAQDISDIITDLMKFARPQNPNKQQVSTAVLIDEALGKLRQTGLDTQKITVKDDSMENVMVDRNQIITAISNVLKNAVEAVELNGTAISVTETSLADSRQAQITISDDAEGMDEKVLVNATMPFYSSKSAGRKRGMGLAIARRFIEINGGSLSMQSSPAAGTKVVIKLPV